MSNSSVRFIFCKSGSVKFAVERIGQDKVSLLALSNRGRQTAEDDPVMCECERYSNWRGSAVCTCATDRPNWWGMLTQWRAVLMLWVCRDQVALSPLLSGSSDFWLQAELISWRMQLLFNRVFQSLTAHLRISDCTSPPPSAPPSSALTWLIYPSLEAVLFSFHSGVIQAFPLQEMFVI